MVDDRLRQINFVDTTLGPVYADKMFKLNLANDGLYYSKAGIWVQVASAAGAPSAHATTHQNGGSDEISVTGLSGLLGDPQTPLGHKASHQNGGTDEVSVAGLSGLLDEAQQVNVRKNSTGSVFTRKQLNFIEGTNITFTVADDGVTGEVDITVNSSGGGIATQVGQVLISTDGTTFVAKMPVTDPLIGWLVDGTTGHLMVS